MWRECVLSVVITNYNYARFVGQAIDSVLGQNRDDVELVVVDDGSTDNSLDVLARYASRVRLLTQMHSGMAAAFTAGFNESRGDWVLFLDADDVLCPDACGRIVAAARDDVVRIQWQTREVDAELRPTGALVPAQRPTEGDARVLVEADGPFAVVNSHGCGTAWSRRFLDSAFPIPEPDFSKHCDAYLATLAALAGPSAVIDEPLSLYRVHGNNDYAGQCRAERYRRTLEVYRLRCLLLAERTGIDPHRWLEGNPHYEWLLELNRACTAIEGAVPPQSTYVLIDEDQWAGGGQLFPDRRNLAFPQVNGRYDGAPADDAGATAGLDAAIAAGATHVLVAPHAHWWLDHYRPLRERLTQIGQSNELTVCALG